MRDQDKTKQQLIAEVEELRQRVTALEGSEGQRRQAEEESAKNRIVLQATIDSLPFDFFAIGADGRYVMQNATSKGRWGNAIGKRPEDVCKNKDDLAVWLDNNRRAFGGERIDEEVTLTIRGEERFYRNVLTPIRGENVTHGILGVNIDITERKRAEEALQRVSEEKYKGLTEASPHAVVMSDLTGRILFASRQTWPLLGLSESDELVGRMVFDYVVQADRQRLAANMAQLVKAGVRRSTEYTSLRPDGSTFPAEASSAVIRDPAGQTKAVMAVIQDISARKKAEEEQRQSLEELRAIYDSMGDGLLIADMQTLRILRANDSICSMLGYAAEELLSLAIPDLHLQEALPIILASLRPDFVGRLPDANNVPMIRKDGGVLYVDITGDALLYHGRPCCLGVFRDVTERREAQAALERERRTLEHMLWASDHERQLIAYDIHDGLAQQLAGALMQFQVYEHLKGVKPDEAQTAYDGGVMLLRQGHFEARRLISGVRPPILDESGVMAAIAHLVHDPAFTQGPKIDFRSRVTFQRLAPVLENVIYRIVQEGLTNARNHSRSSKILVSLRQRGDRLRIEIRDWGVGFDPLAVQDNRFGLEGIRERARLLGGKCSIKSQPGAGTSIIVELLVVAREVK